MVIMFGIILVLLYVATGYLFVYLKKRVEKVRVGQYSIETGSYELPEPIKAPNPELKNLNRETVNLFEGKSGDQIVVFVSGSCIYCNSHIETLMHEIEDSKKRPNHLTVIMDEDYEKYGRELFLKYGYSLTILLADQEALKQFGFIKFLPAFALINKQQDIIVITPVPQVVLNYWNQLKVGA